MDLIYALVLIIVLIILVVVVFKLLNMLMVAPLAYAVTTTAVPECRSGDTTAASTSTKTDTNPNLLLNPLF